MEHTKLNVGFITTVSGRWPRELPRQRDKEYSEWLAKEFSNANIIKSTDIAVDNNEVEKTTEFFKKSSVDLCILLMGAFTGDYAVTYLAEELKVPVVIWAPYEPPYDGGRLMANALVASTMNAAALHRLGMGFHFVYGSYTDARVQDEITRIIRVHDTIKKLKNTFLGLLGYRPTAFYSSAFDEGLIRKKFGIKIEEFDLAVILEKARKVDMEKIRNDNAVLKGTSAIDCNLPEEYIENHSRLYFAIDEFIKEKGFNALLLKCWPELGELKFTPCAVIGRFADQGYLIGCEGDMDATISMLIQSYITGKQTFMTDLIDINEKENTALFWHCGQAGLKLKDPDSDVMLRNHPLAGQGTAYEMTLKPGPVNICRMSKIGNEYKLFMIKGKAVPTKKVTKGVMVNVELDVPVLKTLYKIAEEGVPHHYSIVWEDIYDDMLMFCKVMGIEVIEV